MGLVRAGLCTAIGLVGAVFAFQSTAITYHENVAPFSAPFSIGSDALVELARQKRGGDGVLVDASSTQDPTELARKVLARRPLDSVAARMLGGNVSEDLTQLPELAALKLSERISRRDRTTQGLLILQAARDGDSEAALEHIDLTLTARPANVETMLPQLLVLIGEADGRSILADYAKRSWFASFANQAIVKADDPRDVALLVQSVEERYGVSQLEGQKLKDLVTRLADFGDHSEAFVIARFTDFDVSGLEEFSPSAANIGQEIDPLTWRLADGADGGLSLADDGKLEISMEPGARIDALLRVTGFAAGQRGLRFQVSKNRGVGALGQWSMRCSAGDRWLPSWQSGWVTLSEGVDFEEVISIVPDCLAQKWIFMVQSDDGQRDSELTIGFDLTEK